MRVYSSLLLRHKTRVPAGLTCVNKRLLHVYNYITTADFGQIGTNNKEKLCLKASLVHVSLLGTVGEFACFL